MTFFHRIYGNVHGILWFLIFWSLIVCAGPVHAQSPSPIPSQIPAQDDARQVEPVGTATFYSHAFGENFPHAFVMIDTANELGQKSVDGYGFSPTGLTPALFLGSVDGHIVVPTARYIRQSEPIFSVPLLPAQYARMDAIRTAWSRGKGSRYNLNDRNCVHFIGEIAQAAGLDVNPDSPNFKKPEAYLREVMALNPGVTPVEKGSERIVAAAVSAASGRR